MTQSSDKVRAKCVLHDSMVKLVNTQKRLCFGSLAVEFVFSRLVVPVSPPFSQVHLGGARDGSSGQGGEPFVATIDRHGDVRRCG